MLPLSPDVATGRKLHPVAEYTTTDLTRFVAFIELSPRPYAVESRNNNMQQLQRHRGVCCEGWALIDRSRNWCCSDENYCHSETCYRQIQLLLYCTYRLTEDVLEMFHLFTQFPETKTIWMPNDCNCFVFPQSESFPGWEKKRLLSLSLIKHAFFSWKRDNSWTMLRKECLITFAGVG